jgi:hypothetical protein
VRSILRLAQQSPEKIHVVKRLPPACVVLEIRHFETDDAKVKCMQAILAAGAFLVGVLMFFLISKKKKVAPGSWTTKELIAVGVRISIHTATEMGNGYGFVPTAEQTGAGSDELYSFTPQSQTGSGINKTFPYALDLGTFSLSSAGVLTFTGSAAAVPEPSAYALGICAALLFLVLRRRSTVA